MSLSPSEVQELYTKKIDGYTSFIGIFQAPSGMWALLKRSGLLRDGLRTLDAGCGFGMVTFALIEALREKNLDYQSIDAFDLTPAMLTRFQRALEAHDITGVQLRQADVLADTLPPSWTEYYLILSASMLEYLPKQELARAREVLRARLAQGGSILVVITRKTPETKVLIEWWWYAERYMRHEVQRAYEEAGFLDPVFRRFPSRYSWLNRANYVIEARR